MKWLGAPLIACGILLATVSLAQLPGTFSPVLQVGAGVCTPNTQGGTFANVVGLWHFDNNGNDNSSGAHNLTLTGAAAYSSTQSKFGGFAYKGGAAASAAQIGGTVYNGIGDFTIEFWLNVAATPANGSSIISDGTSGGAATTLNINFAWNAGSKHEYLYSGGSDAAYTGSFTWATSAWHHYAWVRSGSTITFYYDGAAQPTTTVSGSNTVGNGSAAWVIGNYYNGGSLFWKDYIDEMRFSNVARYTANFTPQTLPFCNN